MSRPSALIDINLHDKMDYSWSGLALVLVALHLGLCVEKHISLVYCCHLRDVRAFRQSGCPLSLIGYRTK